MKQMGAVLASVSLLTLGIAADQARAAEPSSARAVLPANADILKLLKARIDEQRGAHGMVVGVLDASGPRIVPYGVMAQDDPRPVDGDTVFEIQSITKTFTTLLLADMVQRGEVGLDDPVARLLPPGVKVPERNGRQITLVDLATHTSGLPEGVPMRRRADGFFEEYTTEDLYAFLAGYTLTRDPGAAFEYSNTGAGLLGIALARRAGMDFAELVRTRILAPLGMTSSAVLPTEAMKMRLAGGHDPYLRRLRPPETRTLEGSWALRSTARDMLAYLAAELGYRDTPLKAAMAMQLAVRRPVSPGVEQGLGWEVRTFPAGELATKNGGGRGYGAFAAFDRRRRTGVIVLTNREKTPGEDIGRHLLIGTPVAVLTPPRPPSAHTEIAVDPALLQRYAGSYRLNPGQLLVTVRARDGRLFGQAPGTPEVPLYPESLSDFFAKGPDVLVSFQVESDRVTGLRLQLNGEIMRGSRVEPPILAPASR